MNKGLKDSFELLACAREQCGIPFGPLAPKLSVAEVRRMEKSTGRHFPEEYVAFCQLHGGEIDPFGVFFDGCPFVPLTTGLPIFLKVRDMAKDVRTYHSYLEDEWTNVSFSELDGNGLHFQTTATPTDLCLLYDVGHGVAASLQYRSIEALLLTMAECLNQGLLSVITGEPLSDYSKIRMVAKKFNA